MVDYGQIGCWAAVIALGGYNLGLTAMFLDYRVKMNERSVKLEKNDQRQEKHDQEQHNRICKLEEKNGKEQAEIDRLKELTEKQNNKIDTLEGIIRNAMKEPHKPNKKHKNR
jgi:uncharacterized protein HemX